MQHYPVTMLPTIRRRGSPRLTFRGYVMGLMNSSKTGTLSSRELSRRTFVKAMGAIAAAAPVALNLAGCGSQRASEAGSSGTSGSDSGTLTFGQSSEPASLDPALIQDGASSNVTNQIYETLVRFDEDSSDVQPWLAEKYEISEDGLTYTFHLREGVKFHDGTDFNAEAVKRSIDRQLEPNRTEDMPYASFNFGSEDSGTGVASIECPDDYTVVFTLCASSTPFIKNLAMQLSSPIVSPSALDEYDNDLTENPVGTGPFTFRSWDHDQSIVLDANEDYWNDDAAPKVDTIVFRFISETASRVTALGNGECDVIEGVDMSTADQVKSAGKEILTTEGMNINYVVLRTDQGPMMDVEARRAVRQAIDVDALVDALYGDYATVANSFMPVWMAPYDKDVEQLAYDPDAAAATFKELGITELTMLTYSSQRNYNPAGGQELAESIQGYLSDAGVKLTINSYDWTTYLDRNTVEDWDLCATGWIGDNGDPDNFMNLFSDTDPSINMSRFANDDYTALIQKGTQTPDGDERDDIYLQCEKMIADQVPAVVICHTQTLDGYDSSVKGLVRPMVGTFYLSEVSKG